MKRGLAGNVVLDVRNGALVGIDLNDIVGSAGSFLQSRGRQTGVLDERKRTEFTQLTGSARIKDGVAVNDDLKAQTKTLVLTGSGRMDLAADELDYTLRTQVAAVPAGSPECVALADRYDDTGAHQRAAGSSGLLDRLDQCCRPSGVAPCNGWPRSTGSR